MSAVSESRSATVIVPVWNVWEQTNRCLDSLKRTLRPGDQVVVVDNGSRDETAARLESFDWISVIRNDENLGFAKACNQGALAARNDLLIFLNNDTVVFEGWLDELLSPFCDSKVAAVGPRSNAVSGHQAVLEVPYRFDDVSGMEEFALAWRRTHSGKVFEAGRLVGFCLAVRRDAFAAVDGFDEGYSVGGMEDDDLCMKLRSAGHHLVVANGCYIHHDGHATFDLNGVDWHGFQAQNHRRFLEKWGIDRLPPLKLLSVCLIVKDEEEMLDQCLASVADIADEIVVYDTGSSDRTIDIAHSHGAKVIEGYWDDSFARARNAVLGEAGGKWVLSIDADENFICDPGHLRSVLLDWNSTIESFLVSIENLHGAGNAPSVHTAIRLFRRDACKWQHRLHEQVVAADDPSRHLRVGYMSGCRIIHHGYSADVFESRNKAQRNLALARAAVEDGDVSRPYALMNLGRALESVGESGEAVTTLTEAAGISDDPIVKRLAIKNLIYILSRQGRFEESLAEVVHLREASVSQIAADIAEGHVRIAMGDPEAGLGLLARVPLKGRDDEGMEYEAHMLAAMRGGALASLGRYGEAADTVLEAMRTSGVLEADIGELTSWLAKAGRQPGEIADSVSRSDLVPMLGRMLRQPPPLADELIESVWLRFPDHLEPLAAAARVATRLPIARAMVWSSRLRQKGLASACPLAAIAKDGGVHPSLRVLAAAAAFGAFDDHSVVNPFQKAKSLLSADELPVCLDQVSRIAPGILDAEHFENSISISEPQISVPRAVGTRSSPQRQTIARVASVASRGGVNIVGPFRSDQLYGQVARNIAFAARQAGLAVSTTNFGLGGSQMSGEGILSDDGDHPYDATLMVLPPEELANFVIENGMAAFEGRYIIGYWIWDYDMPSEIMGTASRMVHEIWAPSLFSARAIEGATDRSVLKMRLPVVLNDRVPRAAGEFDFLYCIDYASGFERQNPRALIQAFKSAFPGSGPQVLLIEANNARLYPREHGRIGDLISGRSDILLVDNTGAELGDCLYGRDPRRSCLISPHRSEGTGVAISKAMSLGIATIVTGNSFSSEFQRRKDSFQIAFRRTAYHPGETGCARSGFWAEPDIVDLAAALRLVVGQPNSALARAQRGFARAKEYFSPESVAEAMRDRLAAIDLVRYGDSKWTGQSAALAGGA